MPWGDAVRCRDRCRVALGRFVFRRAITAGCAPSRAGRCPGAIFPVRSSVVRRRFCPGGRLEEGAGEGRMVAASFGTGRSSVRLQSIGGRKTGVTGGGVFLWGGEFFFPDRMIAERAGGLLRGRRGFALVHPGSSPDGRSCAKGDGMVFDSRENRRRYRVPIVQDGPFRWRRYLKPRRPDVAEVTLGIVRGRKRRGAADRCGRGGPKTFGAGFGWSLCVAPLGAESLGETLESPGVRTDVRFGGRSERNGIPFPRRGLHYGGFDRRGRNGICGMSVA